MITDINGKSRITTLNRKKLNDYWVQYFDYEKDISLFNLTKEEFVKEIDFKSGKINVNLIEGMRE